MKDNIFVDTNILLYLLSDDLDKKSVSKKILRSKYKISVQVLNEFSNISLKKLKLSVSDTKKSINSISKNSIVYNYDENTILKSLDLKDKYKYQFYDCLILAVAIENNCTILYSEDMQHNQIIENQLKIINPFI